MMKSLHDKVKEIVEEYILMKVWFCAYDVGVEVKRSNPNFKFSDVRDIVKSFTNLYKEKEYTSSKQLISINLNEFKEAVLYYPLTSSWDVELQARCCKKMKEKKENDEILRSINNGQFVPPLKDYDDKGINTFDWRGIQTGFNKDPAEDMFYPGGKMCNQDIYFKNK